MEWTTNDPSNPSYQELNVYGDHYWMVDMDMDCDQTEDGWFELQGYMSLLSENDGYETEIAQMGCVGDVSGGAPYVSSYHMAQCGYINVFEFNQEECQTVAFTKEFP